MDPTPFEGFEETMQLFKDLEKCLQLKTEFEEFSASMGQQLFWKADIPQIQTTVQARQPLNPRR